MTYCTGKNNLAHTGIGKGISANGLQALRNGKADRLIHILITHIPECLCADAGNTLTDHNTGNLGFIFIPGSGAFLIQSEITHVTGTGNGQGAGGLIKGPGQVFAAGAAGSRIRYSLFRLGRRLITTVGQSQDAGITPQGSRFIVISKSNIAAGSCKGIAAGNGAGGTRQEQTAIRTGSAAVAVGHVHQIVAAIQGDDVPHMAACTGAAGHLTGDGIAVNAAGLIAQVLEGLGIALADHIGFAVAVKDPDQLPGVRISGEAVGAGCSVVIGYQIADLIPEACQLVVDSGRLVFFHNCLCVGCCSNGRRCHSRIDHRLIFTVAGALQILYNCENKGRFGN